MELARISDKGQITIPAAIRDKMKLKAGDKIVILEENGRFYFVINPTKIIGIMYKLCHSTCFSMWILGKQGIFIREVVIDRFWGWIDWKCWKDRIFKALQIGYR